MIYSYLQCEVFQYTPSCVGAAPIDCLRFKWFIRLVFILSIFRHRPIGGKNLRILYLLYSLYEGEFSSIKTVMILECDHREFYIFPLLQPHQECRNFFICSLTMGEAFEWRHIFHDALGNSTFLRVTPRWKTSAVANFATWLGGGGRERELTVLDVIE